MPLFLATVGTQIIATLIVVYGIILPPIGWKLSLFVWGYALSWFVLNDLVKIAASPIKHLSLSSVCDSAPLYREFEDLVDLKKLNRSKTWLVVTATDVESGEITRFDNHDDQNIFFDHIVASASLPPGLPMAEINGKHYWDVGLFSNTPLRAAIGCLEDLDEKVVKERHNMEPNEPNETTDFTTVDRVVHAWQARFTDSVSPDAVMLAYLDWLVHLANSPGKQLQLMEDFLHQSIRFGGYALQAAALILITRRAYNLLPGTDALKGKHGSNGHIICSISRFFYPSGGGKGQPPTCVAFPPIIRQ